MRSGPGAMAAVTAAVTALVTAACASPPVDTERADAVVGPMPTVAGPAPLEEAPPASDTTGPDTTIPPTTADNVPDTVQVTVPDTLPDTVPGTLPATDPPDGGFRDVSLGVGDELFPDLGSSDVDVLSYAVALTLDDADDTIEGSLDLVALVASDVDVLPLDQVGLDIGTVTVDDVTTSFDLTDTELLIDLPVGDASGVGDEREVKATIDYTFDADEAVSTAGLPSGWFEDQLTGQSYVLNEPDGARVWMPSNDHPSDKATWSFDITAPEGVVAIANGELTGRPTAGDDRPWSWRLDEPMPTYLVQLIVGDYELVIPDPLTSVDGDEISIVHAIPAGTRDSYQAAFDTVAEQLAFFEERFGPYPLQHYGLAFVSGLTGSAMETQGRSMFGAADFADGTLGYTQQLLLAHELAHQWFGNAVSPADWSDIWLNESITTYAQWLWLDSIGIQPLEPYADEMLARRQSDGGSTGEPTVDDMFGFLRYDGGAPVVHALRATMGDDPFFDLLTRWVAENEGTSQTTETFIALAEEVHGADLGLFFDQWLFASDLPADYP